MNTNRIGSGKQYYILIIIVSILAISSGCGALSFLRRDEFKAALFKQIHITGRESNSSFLTDKNEIALYAEAFNSAKEYETVPSLDTFTKYHISLEGKKERHSKTAAIYVDNDLDNKNLFILSNNVLKKIDTEYFADLLDNPVFDSLYPYRTPPETFILFDGEKKQIDPADYEWHFVKADAHFHAINKNQTEKDDPIAITVTDSMFPPIESAVESDALKFELIRDDTVVFSTTDIENEPFSLDDGSYQGILELQWFENPSNTFFGKQIYQFDVTIDNPPEFQLSADKLDPGELLVITAKNINAEEDISLSTDIDFQPNIFGEGSQKVILLPVSYYHQDGKTYSISISSGETTETFEVELMDKEFITQYMTIDTKIAAATRNDDSAREVAEKVAPLRPVCDPEQYWEGPFIQPVDGGRVSPADFGKRRYVNNAPTSYRHNGLDIGHDQGTPVKASNHGRVILADYLIGTGNTVIIEHGYGLKSWYYHMVSLNTKEGDMVKKGDVIGLVGSTGFSTGPHLHFSISVNNVYVNPMTFFEDGVPLLN